MPDRKEEDLSFAAETLTLLRSRSLPRRLQPWTVVVWVAMLMWSCALFGVARSYYADFAYQKFDLGNMVQAVWSTAHARPLEATFDTGEQSIRLAGHMDPILALLAPFWLLAPTPLTLIGVQIVACASGALPVLWLGRKHLRSETSAGVFALAYLAYPWLAWTALDAMHPVTLAIPFFLYAIWFLDSDRLMAFGLCAALAMATGELMGLPIAALGLWYWRAHGRPRAGLATAGAGLAWTITSVKVVFPALSGAESRFYSYYDSVGGSPEGVVRTAFTEPGAIVAALTSRDDLVYMLALSLPLAASFVLAPALAAAALPQLAANGLSSLDGSVEPRAHYIAAIVPFLVAAGIFGAARLPERARLSAVTAVLALCAGMSFLLAPWPGLPSARPYVYRWAYGTPSQAHLDALRDAIALIPQTASVASTNKVGSRLSDRRYIFSVPVVCRADWLVIDALDPWVPLAPRGPTHTSWGRFDPSLLMGLTRRISVSANWQKVFERDWVLVFRRDDDPTTTRCSNA